MFANLPDSVLQMSMIFLSVVIEALPFVLLGCLISGALQVFLTPERVRRLLPKNKLASILVGCVLGFFFPSCECGIVPIINRFITKGVPIPTAFAFMLTAPIVNPIVLFSTYIAFGNSTKFALLRVGGAFFVAIIVGSWLAYFYQGSVLKKGRLPLAASNPQVPADLTLTEEVTTKSEPIPATVALMGSTSTEVTGSSTVVKSTGPMPQPQMKNFLTQVNHVLHHSLDEFFDTGRYLIIGALIASAMQTYLPTAALLTLGSSKLLAILVMLVLAFVMSLCSEADAFIGASLMSLFGTAPVVAFLVLGPMVDIKNLLMMNRYFSGKFILALVALIVLCVTGYAWVV
ncbi:permease [Enterococcus asini]|uniref:permease n=1 Tax=Enterococcus asini TaxID=57732 RepID=UPI001E550F63|nr:permease [Enterococcus asini]MCD5028556.1 permease [Enterococcus asini]MDT2783241.1 permease [Enterococcus asini]